MSYDSRIYIMNRYTHKIKVTGQDYISALEVAQFELCDMGDNSAFYGVFDREIDFDMLLPGVDEQGREVIEIGRRKEETADMWKYIIIALVVWEIYKLLQSSSQTANFDEAMKKFRKDQERIDRQVQQAYQANERLFRQQAQEERARLAAEEMLAKEQERQAKILEKHEKRIQALEYKVRKINRDVESLYETLGDYYGQLDWLQLQQAGTVTGSKQFASWQNKIISKTNQIRKVENRIADLKDIKEQAEKELSA